MCIRDSDMGVHYQITNRMGIMYSGSMVELGPTDDIFASPLHPYTQMLIRSLPKIGDQGKMCIRDRSCVFGSSKLYEPQK